MNRFMCSLIFLVAVIAGLSFVAWGGVAWAIPNSQYVCQDVPATTDSATLIPIDDNFFVTANNGFLKRNCIVTLSVEAGVNPNNQAFVEYSIDDGPTQPIGPSVFTVSPDLITTTGVGVIQLGKGMHKIQPYFRVLPEGGFVEFDRRCLIVECWTK